jgi:hypothetical protein
MSTVDKKSYWCELTVTPGLSEWDNYVKVYDSCTFYGNTCTIYNFSDPHSVMIATKHLEHAGYIVRKRDNNDDSYVTNHTVIFAGMPIGRHNDKQE